MRTTIAVLLAVALAGCDLNATAEADSVCVTQPTSATIPGVPGGASGTVTSPVAFTIDVGAAIPGDVNDKGITTEVIAQSITVSTTTGVDLSGIDTADLTVAKPGDPAGSIVFHYARPAGVTGPTTAIVATPSARVNLVEYLEGQDQLRISGITVSGQPPAASWTPTLRTCASTKIDVDYLDAAGL
jgi:hypothetical protein